MAYTDKELEFMDSYSSDIEEGPNKLKEVFGNITKELGAEGIRLKFLLVYMNFGPNGFVISDHVSHPPSKITGALANHTGVRALGSGLLPAMFRSQTKTVLYKINVKEYKIEDSKKYPLSTKEDLDREMSEGGYNLAIMDSPKYVDSVNETFNGDQTHLAELEYSFETARFIGNSILASTQFTTNNASGVKILIKDGLYKRLVEKFGADFSKIYTDILDTTVNGVKW